MQVFRNAPDILRLVGNVADDVVELPVDAEVSSVAAAFSSAMAVRFCTTSTTLTRAVSIFVV